MQHGRNIMEKSRHQICPKTLKLHWQTCKTPRGLDWGPTCLDFESPSYHELAGDTRYKKSQPDKEEKPIPGKDCSQAQY